MNNFYFLLILINMEILLHYLFITSWMFGCFDCAYDFSGIDVQFTTTIQKFQIFGVQHQIENILRRRETIRF